MTGKPLLVTPREDVPDCYTVQSGREIYHVDFKAMSCDCPAGCWASHRPCRHYLACAAYRQEER